MMSQEAFLIRASKKDTAVIESAAVPYKKQRSI
jgi:hypothetical protein